MPELSDPEKNQNCRYQSNDRYRFSDSIRRIVWAVALVLVVASVIVQMAMIIRSDERSSFLILFVAPRFALPEVVTFCVIARCVEGMFKK